MTYVLGGICDVLLAVVVARAASSDFLVYLSHDRVVSDMRTAVLLGSCCLSFGKSASAVRSQIFAIP